jgi:hypothetical protein
MSTTPHQGFGTKLIGELTKLADEFNLALLLESIPETVQLWISKFNFSLPKNKDVTMSVFQNTTLLELGASKATVCPAPQPLLREITAINMHRPRRSRALQDYRELWCTDGSGPQFATHWCGKLSQHSLPDTEQATVTRLKGLFKGIFPSAWDAETFFDHQDNINHRGFCMIEQLSCTPGMPNKPICVALTTVTSQVLVVRIGAREIESSGGSPEPPGPLTWTFYDLFYMQTIRTIYYR